ncbi:MarR family winged helix-turn-helix transcriptional regulator [Streptomyces sp. NPDC008001]|uniref:MarR family winged helix-turn-helix transcriptional regulator n=1 Tax=Streptomyces sp. NPDC008001 TaxID=3364804 RepID=UPI0036E7B4E4
MTEPYEPALDHIRALPSWLLNRAAGRGRRLLGEAFAQEGLRMPHHAVLAALADGGPAAQAALVRTTGFDPKDMVGLLNDLQRVRLVTRTPDPGDRRKNVIALTAEGCSCLERLARLGDEANRSLLAALTPAEREQFVALLARVAEEREEGPLG